jgi:hypothetical protein
MLKTLGYLFIAYLAVWLVISSTVKHTPTKCDAISARQNQMAQAARNRHVPGEIENPRNNQPAAPLPGME